MGSFGDRVHEPGDFSILLFSLAVALAATLLVAPCAIALAWMTATRSFRGKVIVESFLSLPLVLPPTAVGLALLATLSENSPVGRLLSRLGADVVFTWKAAVIAAAVMSFPLFVRSARTAFESVDPRLVAMARTLGDTPARAFFRIALPMARRGLIAGALLSYCRALGEFGATILVAGNIPGKTQTLALAIFQRSQTGRDGDALRLVVLTALVAWAAVYASEVLSRKKGRLAP